MSYSAFFLAYLIGSLSFAVIISRVMHLPDPRTYGSNNPGATNVLRGGNKTAAALVLLFDALKGAVAVLLAQYFALQFGFEDTTIAFVGVAAFIGHLFPVFFRFQGGKGVATAAGVLIALEPGLGLATVFIWIVIAAIFRYSSLAAILAATFAPFFSLLFLDRPEVSLAVSVMSLLLIWRHWRNIVKLLTGKETKIGEKEPEKPKRRRRRANRIGQDVPQTAPAPLGQGPATRSSASPNPTVQGKS